MRQMISMEVEFAEVLDALHNMAPDLCAPHACMLLAVNAATPCMPLPCSLPLRSGAYFTKLRKNSGGGHPALEMARSFTLTRDCVRQI